MQEEQVISKFERVAFYFETPGKENTETLLRIVREYVNKMDVRNMVLASTSGETALQASEIFADLNLVVVTHHSGFRALGTQEFEEKSRIELESRGVKVLTATHALSGVERAIRRKFDTIGSLEIIANTLRLFGEGTKVCVEIALMAADAGLIPEERDVLAIAGSGRGADTALLLRPTSSSRFFDLEIREIIAKPYKIR